jgi:hypothetical protein
MPPSATPESGVADLSYGRRRLMTDRHTQSDVGETP